MDAPVLGRYGVAAPSGLIWSLSKVESTQVVPRRVVSRVLMLSPPSAIDVQVMSHAPGIDVAAFRKRLKVLESELESVAASGAEAARTVELDQSRVGRLSRMDAIRSQAMSVESERRRALQLSRIHSAMKRIEDGEFGYCLSCGDPIAPKRLKIDPAAHLCIACASAAESHAS